MGESVRPASIEEWKRFFSPALSDGTEELKSTAEWLGKILRNLTEKLRVQYERIVFYIQTMKLTHGGEWKDNDYLAKSFSANPQNEAAKKIQNLLKQGSKSSLLKELSNTNIIAPAQPIQPPLASMTFSPPTAREESAKEQEKSASQEGQEQEAAPRGVQVDPHAEGVPAPAPEVNFKTHQEEVATFQKTLDNLLSESASTEELEEAEIAKHNAAIDAVHEEMVALINEISQNYHSAGLLGGLLWKLYSTAELDLDALKDKELYHGKVIELTVADLGVFLEEHRSNLNADYQEQLADIQQKAKAIAAAERANPKLTVQSQEEKESEKAAAISTGLKQLIEQFYDYEIIKKATAGDAPTVVGKAIKNFYGQEASKNDLIALVSNVENCRKEKIDKTLNRIKETLHGVLNEKGLKLEGTDFIAAALKEMRKLAFPPLSAIPFLSIKKEKAPTPEMRDRFEEALKKNRLTLDLIKETPALVDLPLSSGQLPLQYAIFHGNSTTIDFLIHYANLEQTNPEGHKFFDIAVQAGKMDVAERIMEKSLQNVNAGLTKLHDTLPKLVQTVQKEINKNIAVSKQMAEVVQEVQLQSMQARLPFGNNLKLVEKIQQKDLDGFLKYAAAGAQIFTKDPKTGKTLLHLAIENGCEEIALYLCGESIYLEAENKQELMKTKPEFAAMVKKLEKFITIADNDKNTAEIAASNHPALKAMMAEFTSNNISKETREKYLPLYKTKSNYQQQAEFLQRQEILKKGYVGHNPLLLQSMYEKDFKKFLRFSLDGADSDTQDPKTGFSLFHLAINAGQLEIAHFLLNKTTRPIGDVSLSIAKQQKNPQMIELVKYHQQKKVSKEPVEVPLFIQKLEERIAAYTQNYQEAKQEFSQTERTQREHSAKYGTNGHHKYIFKAIEEGDVPALIQARAWDLPFNTLMLPPDAVGEDPQGYKSAFRQANKNLEQTRRHLTNTNSVEPGLGKSLLDVAVRFAFQKKEENLPLISYLLEQGLDPLAANDEGDTPLSIAFLSGQYRTAYLMLSHQAQGIIPSKELGTSKDFQRACASLTRASQMSDPLQTKWSASIIAAMAYFSIYFGPGRFVSPFYALLPYIDNIFILDSLSASQPTFGEQLARRNAANPLPEPVVKVLSNKSTYKVISGLQTMSLLEMATPLRGEGVFGTLGTLSMSTYNAAMGVFSSFANAKAAWKYRHDRPIQGVYKVATEAMAPMRSIMRLFSLVSVVLPSEQPQQPKQPELQCESIDPKAYAQAREKIKESSIESASYCEKPSNPFVAIEDSTPLVAVKAVENALKREAIAIASDPKLNPLCAEHAKVILSRAWDEKAFKAEGEQYVKRTFRNYALIVHPDKGGTEEASQKLNIAQETMVHEAELNQHFDGGFTARLTSTQGYWIKTAAKVALVMGAMQFPVFNSYMGKTLFYGSFVYDIASNVFGTVRDAGSRAYEAYEQWSTSDE